MTAVTDFKSFGFPGISKALRIPGFGFFVVCFSSVPSSSTKGALGPVRLSGLTLYFRKLHILVFLLGLYRLQKNSSQLTLLLVGY